MYNIYVQYSEKTERKVNFANLVIVLILYCSTRNHTLPVGGGENE